MSDHAQNGFLLVGSLCELANKSSDDVGEGCLAYVADTAQYFKMTTDASPLTPDGSTVITTWGGPAMAPCAQSLTSTGIGRWVLTNLAAIANPFAAETDWYIDPVAGVDTYTGLTALSPLKTFTALAARWAGITTETTATVTVHVLDGTALSAGDHVVLRRPVSSLFPLQVEAPLARTVLASSGVGGVIAYTPLDHATNVSCQLQGLLTVGAWAAYPLKVIVLTSGVNAGAWAVILEDLGGDVAKITPFVKQTPNTTGSTVPALTQISPVPGVTFEIVSFISLNDSLDGNYPLIDVGSGNVWFHDVSLDDAGGSAQTQPDGISSAGVVYVYRSTFSATARGLSARTCSGITWGGCGFHAAAGFVAIAADSAIIDFEACGYDNASSTVSLGGVVIFDGDTALLPGTQVLDITAPGVVIGNLNIDKAASPAIDLAYNESLARASRAAFNGSLYGATIPTSHISLHDFCLATYGAATHFYAAVTGGQHPLDFQNGVNTKDYADLPFGSTATFADSQAMFLLQK